MCEDDELWFRLAEHGEVDAIDAALTLVRRHGQHSGSDILAWRDRRRVFEKALRARHDDHLASILSRLRAEMSVGLANSQAVSGKRISALGTVLSSAHYSWRFPQWWRGAPAYLCAGGGAQGRSQVPRRRRSTATITGLIS